MRIVRLQCCRFFIVVLLMGVLVGCEHRPLVDYIMNVHVVRVYIDEEIKNVTHGFYDDALVKPPYASPKVLYAALADPVTGTVVSEGYLQTVGRDHRGYYIEGFLKAEAGDYHLLVYSWGVETTMIRHKDNFYRMEGYTYQIADHLQTGKLRAESRTRSLHYEPGHLFIVAQENVHVGQSDEVDTLCTSDGKHFTALSCAQSYYLQVRVKGAQYISDVSSSLSGMGTVLRFCDGALSSEGDTELYLPMNVALKGVASENYQAPVIYTTFSTFGKLPGQSSVLKVTFEITTLDGRTQTEEIEITDLFYSQLAQDHHWLLVEKMIEIEPPPTPDGGGFEPGVEDWIKEDSEILI